ncbi:MAG TPA: TetR/AcrR family transcriptional regulator [Rariglobus sp.]|jgi:AcrR family transcriptional regulator|nr:TetR/AcrR family transcriptional regulator [Rariglobus sp.]
MSATPATLSKRDQLMTTACRLFYRDGYRVVGIDTILAEAGVAKMTLYNHFPSKDDLIIAALEKRDRELRASMVATVEAAGRSPLKRFLAMFDWLEAWFASDEFKGCAFIRALSEYPEPEHPIHQTAWRHKLAVIDMLTELAKANGAKDPAALANTLSMLIDGAIVAAHATDSPAPCAAARTTALSLLKLATA